MYNDIVKYISGNCDSREASDISLLIENNVEYQELYSQLSRVWKIGETPEVNLAIDTNKAWQNVSSKIFDNPAEIAEPIRKETTFKPSYGRAFVRYAVGIAATLIIGLGLFFLQKEKQPDLLTYTQNSLQIEPITLSDGSVATLNNNSEINFPETFTKKSREVYLWGEAFFDIASEPNRSFIVCVGDLRVKVMGTSFNIDDTSPNETKVSVHSGKVLCYVVDENSEAGVGDNIMLSEGQKLVYDKINKTFDLSAKFDYNDISWKTKKLIFNASTLDEVFEAIAKCYNTSFEVENSEVHDYQITANFDGESLQTVLQTIELIHNIKFVKNDKGYQVK
ncbi:MAG: FecR family protein [Bacteroidales bacterium]